MPKKLFVVYLKLKLNWVDCILWGNPNPMMSLRHVLPLDLSMAPLCLRPTSSLRNRARGALMARLPPLSPSQRERAMAPSWCEGLQTLPPCTSRDPAQLFIRPPGWDPAHCGHPRAPPWTSSPSQASSHISVCFKPLPPPHFLLLVGGKPLVSDQKDPKFHMAFQDEPAAEPLTAKSSQERHRAGLPRFHPWEGRKEHKRHSMSRTGTATGLSAFWWTTDRLGGDWGHCRDEAPKEGARAATMSTYRVLCAQCQVDRPSPPTQTSQVPK